jgi:hypothetical protein
MLNIFLPKQVGTVTMKSPLPIDLLGHNTNTPHFFSICCADLAKIVSAKFHLIPIYLLCIDDFIDKNFE